MSAQLDIFGGSLGPAADHTRMTPAEYRKTQHPTCWEECELCEPELHGEFGKTGKDRAYRLCHPTWVQPRKCFVGSLICDLAVRKSVPAPPKPVTAGWEDY